MTQTLPHYRRVLLKLSGEALMGGGHEPFDPVFLAYLAAEIAAVRACGVRIGVVTGGGNIFRGLAGVDLGVERVAGDYMGMLATVINALALSSHLRRHDCPCRILSPFSLPQVGETVSAASARRTLDDGEVALFCAGTGNPFFTTDSAAVLRALEAGCEVVFKATKVDGIYDRDPVRHPDAVFLPQLTFAEALDRDIRVMDRTAFSMCQENRLPIIVFNAATPGNLMRAARGEAVGSRVG